MLLHQLQKIYSQVKRINKINKNNNSKKFLLKNKFINVNH